MVQDMVSSVEIPVDSLIMLVSVFWISSLCAQKSILCKN